MKGFALCWIVLCHIVEQIAGGEYIANPTVPWPPLAERIAQLRPVNGHGLLDWPLTVVRDLGWFGDQGVTLFLILSGLGLTLGFLRRGVAWNLDIAAFYRRRFERIYPLWWGAHLLFWPTGLFLAAGGLSSGDACFFTDLFGLRFFPQCFYYFSPAWWYVGLILQLYLIYPLLWRFLRSRGPMVFFLVCAAIGFTAIALGPVLFHDAYLDAWQRGAFFVTRLPEFALGMAAAAWYAENPSRFERLLSAPGTLSGAIIAYAAGTYLSLFLPGMIVAPTFLGASAFVLLRALLMSRAGAGAPAAVAASPAPAKRMDVLGLIGRHSYSLYLTHYSFVAALVHQGDTPAKQGVHIVAALLLALASAWVLERSVKALRTAVDKYGFAPYACCGVLLVFGLPLAGEAAVRRFDPQEVLGWGERPSLQPDARFGWTLVPSQTTRLRWEGYDYRVTSNEWGFPVPAYPQAKPANALRILVTGDAYSSAEGVDTENSWPRFLQEDLARALPHRAVQVMNFAITGYGPNEEAAVIDAFAPRFQPDVILIEMFVNDVSDVLTPDATFRRWIGFGSPPADDFRAFVHLMQLHRYLFLRVTEPLLAFLHHKADSEGYFLGNFVFLERGHAAYDHDGVSATARRYAEMARIAAATHADLLVMQVPAPVQVCGADALAYYPRFVDLKDTQRYDLTLPERRAVRITAQSGVAINDLRDPLRGLPACPYQPGNMHLTVAGHQAVAAYAERLVLQRSRAH